MTVGMRITYRELLERHGRVRIPMIQRDYAQGRASESEIRGEFLNALGGALRKAADHPSLPLNLDFVYGSVEGDGDASFLPLDGQQRLTTLFLLHWHLAWADAQWDAFTKMFHTSDGLSRFTYRVRPSSNDFFDALVAFRPVGRPVDVTSLSDLIRDQSWYFRSWRLDPTIQSVLGMLDAIHHRFSQSSGLFDRLIDVQLPAITFQLLDLNNFGLSDDLYIKMNARGKPLTPFETFKARYEQELKTQHVDVTFHIGQQPFDAADYVSRRLDTTWGELFWSLRDPKSDSYDSALMNVFRAIALVTRNPDSSTYLSDISALRSLAAPTYTDFHSRGWLDEKFTLTLVRLLDAWNANQGKLSPFLPSERYFDERAIFEKIVLNGGNLLYSDIVQFAAYAAFVRENHSAINAKAFEQWMRIVYNLSTNTLYNRSEDLRRSMVGLEALLAGASLAERYLADHANSVTGFSEPQVIEERIKAQLMVSNDSWRPIFERAEGHGYFRGQVEFLLSFAGITEAVAKSDPKGWTHETHESLQESFSKQMQFAEHMFVAQGLKDIGQHHWQRALLSLGNYLMPSGRNMSFLSNPATDEGSWKRFLRSSSTVNMKRDLLRQLWSKLSSDQPFEPQLDQVIAESTAIEEWRLALVQCPSALTFCEKHCIRIEGDTVYLLKKIQLNGAHAELFTYCLYTRLGTTPAAFPFLRLAYYLVTDTYDEPFIELTGVIAEKRIRFQVRHLSGQFYVSIKNIELTIVSGLSERLAAIGFKDENDYVSKSIPHAAIDMFFDELNSLMKAIVNP